MQDTDFEYSLVRSPRRRTLSITVDSGAVRVRAPLRMPDRQIRKFVKAKSGWVARKLSESARMAQEAPCHSLVSGEALLFQGKELILSITPATRRDGICVRGDRLVLEVRQGAPVNRVQELVKGWYLSEARAAFLRRAAFYSEALGVEPAGISVRSQKRRWGSCSSKGRISLNWKLVTASPEILDYVVAHELCHLLHRNHGPGFWKAMEQLMPDHQVRRKWLRENGHRLGL